jgi:hypothetical protein
MCRGADRDKRAAILRDQGGDVIGPGAVAADQQRLAQLGIGENPVRSSRSSTARSPVSQASVSARSSASLSSPPPPAGRLILLGEPVEDRETARKPLQRDHGKPRFSSARSTPFSLSPVCPAIGDHERSGPAFGAGKIGFGHVGAVERGGEFVALAGRNAAQQWGRPGLVAAA